MDSTLIEKINEFNRIRLLPDTDPEFDFYQNLYLFKNKEVWRIKVKLCLDLMKEIKKHLQAKEDAILKHFEDLKYFKEIKQKISLYYE